MNYGSTVVTGARMRRVMLTLLAVASSACSQTDVEPAGVGVMQPTPSGTAGLTPQSPGARGAVDSSLPQLPAETPWSSIPEACRGLQLLGMTHSPGGSTLPNKCAPFHGTFNNPYAIRCIDADPAFKTGWQGDEFCILPPPDELGTQIHIGPASYDDAAEVAKFEMMPGQESNTNYYINTKNTERVFYYRTNYRMREGSHHMIISLLAADREDGWAGATELADAGLGNTGFGGAQRTDADRPAHTLEVPPENVGLGGELTPNQQFSFNLHHMNRFDEPILREAWVNVWFEQSVTQQSRAATLFGNPGDLNIPPGERRELHYAAAVSGEMRIIQYFGHRHVSTDRFAVWIERASGEKIPAYESFAWEDMPVYQYDSVSKNPVPDVANKIDGGHTGLLELKDGDEIHFLCDVTNRQDVTLKFSNELYNGEMCIAFGNAVGTGTLGRPTRVME